MQNYPVEKKENTCYVLEKKQTYYLLPKEITLLLDPLFDLDQEFAE